MVVKSFAVKTGSDAGGPKAATGTSSTERHTPPEQHAGGPVGSVGSEILRPAVVDSGATCHIVF